MRIQFRAGTQRQTFAVLNHRNAIIDVLFLGICFLAETIAGQESRATDKRLMVEVQQMLTRVRAEVVAATKNKQVPWSNSSLLGDVYLVGSKP